MKNNKKVLISLVMSTFLLAGCSYGGVAKLDTAKFKEFYNTSLVKEKNRVFKLGDAVHMNSTTPNGKDADTLEIELSTAGYGEWKEGKPSEELKYSYINSYHNEEGARMEEKQNGSLNYSASKKVIEPEIDEDDPDAEVDPAHLEDVKKLSFETSTSDISRSESISLTNTAKIVYEGEEETSAVTSNTTTYTFNKKLTVAEHLEDGKYVSSDLTEKYNYSKVVDGPTSSSYSFSSVTTSIDPEVEKVVVTNSGKLSSDKTKIEFKIVTKTFDYDEETHDWEATPETKEEEGTPEEFSISEENALFTMSALLTRFEKDAGLAYIINTLSTSYTSFFKLFEEQCLNHNDAEILEKNGDYKFRVEIPGEENAFMQYSFLDENTSAIKKPIMSEFAKFIVDGRDVTNIQRTSFIYSALSDIA